MTHFSESDFYQFIKALHFAAIKHKEQYRKDEVTPYINHPIEVTEILWRVGKVHDITTLTASLLHDTVEDTNTKPEEIRLLFGEAVMKLVQEVTDDKNLPKAERKRLQVVHAPDKSLPARQIKIADKISNVYALTHKPPTDWSLERKREYLEWAKQVVDGLRGHTPELEALYDQVLENGREKLALIETE